MHPLPARRLVATFLVAAGCAVSPPPLPKVSGPVQDAVRRGEPVDVVVVVKPPPSLEKSRGKEDPAAKLAEVRQRILSALDPEKVEQGRAFVLVPLLSLRVWDSASLEALAQHPDVVSVTEDTVHGLDLTESLPFIRQPEALALGQDGHGTSVAVMDTGLDYRRAAFGACTSPGQPAGCKVVYAADFAPDDGNVDDNGHGTNVAAIVLGVAPGAQVLGLDVFRGASAYTTDISAAADWCIQHREEYNIVAANFSLGTPTTSGVACDADPLAVVMRTLRDAGIAPAVATGNGAVSTGISSPACSSAAVAVGAVYDSPGNYGYSVCQQPGALADTVTCFTNSSSLLTLLAPGANITAGGITMSGTSQATPHVAGALAVLRAAYPQETIDAVVLRMTSRGTPVRDTRNGLTFPRLDLMAALGGGSVVINDGSGYTTTPTVTLTLTPPSQDTVEMCLDATSTCTTWEALAGTKAWDLAPGTGARQVHGWFRDGLGTVVTAPTASVFLDGVAPADPGLTATPGLGAITLTWSTPPDVGSGVARYLLAGSASGTPATCEDGTLLFSAAGNSFTHTGLQSGVTWSYRLCAEDAAGNRSPGATAQSMPVPERNPPTGSVVINGGATWTRSLSVTLTLAAADASGVGDMCLSNTATCSSWEPYGSSRAWTLGGTGSTRTVYVRYRDIYGNAMATAVTDTIKVDQAVPTGGTLRATAADGQVALSWSGFTDGLSGVASYILAGGTSGTPSACDPATALSTGSATSFTHSGLTNGATWSYRVCAVDNAGNTSTGVTASARPLPESAGPTGTVVVNAGAPYTNLAAVTLDLTADDPSGVQGMCISNNATCTAWEPFAASRRWTLTSGNGNRTVYARFRDTWGTVSVAATDTILLDAAVPANGAVTATDGDGQVSLSWSNFRDTGSGVASYKVVAALGAVPVSCATGSVVYAGTSTSALHTGLTNGETWFYRVCALDNAGNISTGAKTSCMPKPERDGPVGSVVINNGDSLTRTAAVTLTLDATDASAVTSMCITNTASCAAWRPFAATTAWTLATSSGVKTVTVFFKDPWGNRSAATVGTITLDATAPVNGRLTATGGSGQVALAWSGFSDPGSGIAGYRLMMNTAAVGASCTSGTEIYSGTDTSWVQSLPGDNVLRSFRVCAKDVAGNTSTGATATARPVP